MIDSTTTEKMALLTLAMVSILALSAIAILALRSGTVDSNASALIGVIVTGLIAVGKDIVAAVRAYSMSAQLSKVTDQLAASGPVVDVPQQVKVVNEPSEPVPTVEGTS